MKCDAIRDMGVQGEKINFSGEQQIGKNVKKINFQILMGIALKLGLDEHSQRSTSTAPPRRVGGGVEHDTKRLCLICAFCT